MGVWHRKKIMHLEVQQHITDQGPCFSYESTKASWMYIQLQHGMAFVLLEGHDQEGLLKEIEAKLCDAWLEE